MVAIRAAVTQADLDVARGYFRAHLGSPGVGEYVPDYEQELASLPGIYELILLAEIDGRAVGCAALRPRNGECEMKRLYIAPEARGAGVGRALTIAIIEAASQRGYRTLMLDSLPSMTSAHAIYESLGFRPCEPFFDNAPSEFVFYALDLTKRK